MRCFIGIPVPPALAATLTANPVPPTARPVPAANLHLTLAFLGERSRSQLEPLLPPLKNALARFEYGVPDSFRADLFQLDLERIEDQYMAMNHRIPSAENCGLKDDFNGPICYTPDGNPLVGPAPGSSVYKK